MHARVCVCVEDLLVSCLRVCTRNLCLLCNAEAGSRAWSGVVNGPKTSTKEADSGCTQANDNYTSARTGTGTDMHTQAHYCKCRHVRVCVLILR